MNRRGLLAFALVGLAGRAFAQAPKDACEGFGRPTPQEVRHFEQQWKARGRGAIPSMIGAVCSSGLGLTQRNAAREVLRAHAVDAVGPLIAKVLRNDGCEFAHAETCRGGFVMSSGLEHPIADPVELAADVLCQIKDETPRAKVAFAAVAMALRNPKQAGAVMKILNQSRCVLPAALARECVEPLQPELKELNVPAGVLVALGGEAAPLLPDLVEQLDLEPLRTGVVEILARLDVAKLGDAARPALPKLLSRVSSEANEACVPGRWGDHQSALLRAAWNVGGLDAPVESLRTAFRAFASCERERWRVLRDVQSFPMELRQELWPEVASLLEADLAQLCGPDGWKRRRAFGDWRLVFPDASFEPSAMPKLANALANRECPDESIWAILQLVAHIGPAAAEVAPAVRTVLNDERRFTGVREDALGTLRLLTGSLHPEELRLEQAFAKKRELFKRFQPTSDDEPRETLGDVTRSLAVCSREVDASELSEEAVRQAARWDTDVHLSEHKRFGACLRMRACGPDHHSWKATLRACCEFAYRQPPSPGFCSN